MKLSFYGDIDFIPTEQYGEDEAARAIGDARFVLGIVERVIGGESNPDTGRKRR